MRGGELRGQAPSKYGGEHRLPAMPRVIVTPPENEVVVPVATGQIAADPSSEPPLDTMSAADLLAAAFPYHRISPQPGEQHGE